jgi:hypothetical protein
MCNIRISELKAAGFPALAEVLDQRTFVQRFYRVIKTVYINRQTQSIAMSASGFGLADETSGYGAKPFMLVHDCEVSIAQDLADIIQKLDLTSGEKTLQQIEDVLEKWKDWAEKCWEGCDGVFGLFKYIYHVCRDWSSKEPDIELELQEVYSAGIALFVKTTEGTVDDFNTFMQEILAEATSQE